MLRTLIPHFLLSIGLSMFASSSTFQFPVIPDSITDRQERLEYVADHFWDNSTNNELLNYPNLETYFFTLSHIEKTKKLHLLNKFVSQCMTDTATYPVISYAVDFLLGSPDSEYWDDTAYLYVQNLILESNLPEEYKIAPRWRIDLLSKNAVGDLAPSTELIDSEGKIIEIRKLKMPCILIFADSDCNRCEEELSASQNILLELHNSGWNIAVVYLDGIIPQYTFKFNIFAPYSDTEQRILENDIYVARRLPCAYVLDSEARILARELKLLDIKNEITNTY